jgi:hypothetical protein
VNNRSVGKNLANPVTLVPAHRSLALIKVPQKSFDITAGKKDRKGIAKSVAFQIEI